MKDHSWEFILGSKVPKIYIQNLKIFIHAFITLPATKARFEEKGECLIEQREINFLHVICVKGRKISLNHKSQVFHERGDLCKSRFEASN